MAASNHVIWELLTSVEDIMTLARSLDNDQEADLHTCPVCVCDAQLECIVPDATIQVLPIKVR